MVEGRCDLLFLGFTAFVGFNLLSDFLWGGPAQNSESSSSETGGNAAGIGAADLFRGTYRLRSNGTDFEEGTMRMSVASHQTGLASADIALIAMALRGSGSRSSLSSFDPDIVFSGLALADVGKITATGASDPKHFRYLGERPCRLNAVLELVKADSPERGDNEPSKEPAAPGRPVEGRIHGLRSVIGEVSGADCALSLAFAVEAIDVTAFTQKVVHYSIFVNLLTFLQMRLFLAQMMHTEEGPSAARVSIVCIGMMALADAYDSILHLCLGLQSQYMFNTIAVVALFKFILASLLEARYLLTIWRYRQPEVFNQGWETIRRELSWLYSRFYGVLIIGMALLYHNLDRLDLVVLAFQFNWVPQIACDAWQGCKSSLSGRFCVGMSTTRLLYILYLWGCPEGIFSDELYPRLPGSPSSSLCWWAVMIQVLQLAALWSQQRWGPRWFVPWICMPWAYNYHRSPRIDPGTDCVICMGEIDVEDARKCVVTPCNHLFHEACLNQWMDVKMECPTCRTNLPPIQ